MQYKNFEFRWFFTTGEKIRPVLVRKLLGAKILQQDILANLLKDFLWLQKYVNRLPVTGRIL